MIVPSLLTITAAGSDLPMMIKCSWDKALPSVSCIPYPAGESMRDEAVQVAVLDPGNGLLLDGGVDLGERIARPETIGATATNEVKHAST